MPEVTYKSQGEIAVMAEGGEKLSKILRTVLDQVKPGVNTLKLNQLAEEEISRRGGESSFKKVPGYHWATCIGLNDEVVHSIPLQDKIVKSGDLVKVDLGLVWKKFHTDIAVTVEVGSRRQSDFLSTGSKALEKAIAAAVIGNRVGDISLAIEEMIKGAGFTPVKVLTGHGIGRALHEDPMIPCILKGKAKDTPLLKAGMTLAIEVIYNEGGAEVVLEPDGWTIATKNGKMSGLFEKTIAITEKCPLVLTPMDFS